MHGQCPQTKSIHSSRTGDIGGYEPVSQLYHLAYISRNAVEGGHDNIKLEIERILQSARHNNVNMGVTGALLFSGGYFCQVIEGEQQNIEELFEIIQMDPRHNDITVLEFQPIAQRGFAEWSMAFAGMEDRMRFNIEGIKQSKDEMTMQETGRNLVTVLEQLVVQRQTVRNESN